MAPDLQPRQSQVSFIQMLMRWRTVLKIKGRPKGKGVRFIVCVSRLNHTQGTDYDRLNVVLVYLQDTKRRLKIQIKMAYKLILLLIFSIT